jgi:hypothetical protein
MARWTQCRSLAAASLSSRSQIPGYELNPVASETSQEPGRVVGSTQPHGCQVQADDPALGAPFQQDGRFSGQLWTQRHDQVGFGLSF